MRPRIKRSSTRDGHDRQEQRTGGYRTSENNRPRRAYDDRGRYEHKEGRPSGGGKPGYGRKPASGGHDRQAGRGGNRPGYEGRNVRKGFQYRIRTEHPRPAAPSMPVVQKEDDGMVRLNKFIANSGICSRREADEYIAAGLVSVNGQIITEMGVKVNPAEDDVRFNGERLRGEKKVYVLLNKPKDFVTTTSDPHAEKNVMQLISRDLCPERIFPVGRLDKSTTGVLLLTNDGELAEKLTHPSFQKKKIYQVTLDKNVKPEDMDRLVQGVALEDGQAYADEVAYNGDDRSVVGIEIHSGKNRIVRRMFEALGYKVRKLDRVYFAGLTKKNLRRGQWRFLSDEEVTMLKLNFYE